MHTRVKVPEPTKIKRRRPLLRKKKCKLKLMITHSALQLKKRQHLPKKNQLP